MPTWLKARRKVLKNTRSPGCSSLLSISRVAAACWSAVRGSNQTNGLLVHRTHETAAVETGLDRIATPLVRYAQEAHGADDQFRCLAADGLTDLADMTDQATLGQQFVEIVRPTLLLRRCVCAMGHCHGKHQHGQCRDETHEGQGKGLGLDGQAHCSRKCLISNVLRHFSHVCTGLGLVPCVRNKEKPQESWGKPGASSIRYDVSEPALQSAPKAVAVWAKPRRPHVQGH